MADNTTTHFVRKFPDKLRNKPFLVRDWDSFFAMRDPGEDEKRTLHAYQEGTPPVTWYAVIDKARHDELNTKMNQAEREAIFSDDLLRFWQIYNGKLFLQCAATDPILPYSSSMSHVKLSEVPEAIRDNGFQFFTLHQPRRFSDNQFDPYYAFDETKTPIPEGFMEKVVSYREKVQQRYEKLKAARNANPDDAIIGTTEDSSGIEAQRK